MLLVFNVLHVLSSTKSNYNSKCRPKHHRLTINMISLPAWINIKEPIVNHAPTDTVQ